MKLMQALALTGVLLLPFAPALAQGAGETPARITVQGEGRVTAMPDMATVSLGVMAEAPEAAAAVAEMSTQMAAVLESLKTAGIEPRDIQTSGLSVGPRWSSPRPNDAAEPQIVGFLASTQVSVRVRDLDRLGALLDSAVRDGANTLTGVEFGLAEPEAVLDEARRAAVADAARKAGLYAEAAGVALGPVLSIDEMGSAMPRMFRTEMAMMDAGAPMPVAAGELELTSNLSISYALTTAE